VAVDGVAAVAPDVEAPDDASAGAGIVAAPAGAAGDCGGLVALGAGIAAGADAPDDVLPDVALELSVACACARFAKAITADARKILCGFSMPIPFRKNGTRSDVARRKFILIQAP
jgi:hypothetical protein